VKFDPTYSFAAAIDTLLPGVVMQREILDGTELAWRMGGHVPLTQETLLAGLQTAPPGELEANGVAPTEGVPFPVELPSYPTGLPRFADSNPATDGWLTYGAAWGGVP
jgi:hypothetical protein